MLNAYNKRHIHLVLILLLFPVCSIAGNNNEYLKDDSLRVGIAGNEPFIVNADDDPNGISMEIWDDVAAGAGWNYSVKPYKSMGDALDAVAAGEIDIAIGPASITSQRMETVLFSQPYFQSSLSILSRTDPPGIWDRIKPFFSKRFFIAIIVFIFILGCVGTLLWLSERKESPDQFPADPARGIANGMWCAIVTMSTTGYGDRAPVTFLGRVIASAWMIISLIFATTMVAGIASTLTLTGMNQTVISKANQLSGRKVATLPHSPASKFVRGHNGQITEMASLEDGYRLLKERAVDAVVFDRPQLLYFLNEHPDPSVAVSAAEYMKQGYGFALPMQSDLLRPINMRLLQLQEEGRTDRIISEWLGADGIRGN